MKKMEVNVLEKMATENIINEQMEKYYIYAFASMDRRNNNCNRKYSNYWSFILMVLNNRDVVNILFFNPYFASNPHVLSGV